MKKFYGLAFTIAALAFTNAQVLETTNYIGAFAPAPTAMWTDGWAEFNPQNAVYPAPNVEVTANITTDTHWTAGNTYILRNQIYVKNGATLTIDPGVVIRGDHNATGAGLFITRGSKIMAVGTATQPIVFTSDNAAGSRAKGDWGGVILLGKGAYNVNGGVNYIEGIAQSPDTQYGGGATPDNADNSGTLKYVRIEFAGYVYAPNQEINGLTFGAVGSGTTIDNVQVSHSNDDAFEWFGGAVNCKHLVSFRNLDDDFDTDNGYSGTVQYGLVIRDPQIADDPAVSTSEGFESDNNANGTAVSPYTSANFSNITLLGPVFRSTLPNGGAIAAGYKRGARLRRNTQLKINRSIFMSFINGLFIDGASTEANATAGNLVVNNTVIAGTRDKALEVTSTSTFDITSWFNAATFAKVSTGNIIKTSAADLLVKPYDLTNGQNYTGMDYRPANTLLATGENGTRTEVDYAFANPFTNSFNIQLKSANKEAVKVTIFDMTGRQLENASVSSAALSSKYFGANLKSGLYMMKVQQGAQTKAFKIIKK